MLRSVGERLLVLIPSHYYTMPTTKWSGLFESDISSSPVEFTKHQFLGYTGVVSTNPFFDNFFNGMHLSDYQSGFVTHNYGCAITFSEDTESILITWQEVLEGKKTDCKYGDLVLSTVMYIPILLIVAKPVRVWLVLWILCIPKCTVIDYNASALWIVIIAQLWRIKWN